MVTSPLILHRFDESGRAMSVRVDFDNATRAIHDVVVHRDAGCDYAQVVTGVEADGTRTAVTRSWAAPAGTARIPDIDLSSRGIRSIDDLLTLHMTLA
jgi:hypothetical protein